MVSQLYLPAEQVRVRLVRKAPSAAAGGGAVLCCCTRPSSRKATL